MKAYHASFYNALMEHFERVSHRRGRPFYRAISTRLSQSGFVTNVRAGPRACPHVRHGKKGRHGGLPLHWVLGIQFIFEPVAWIIQNILANTV